MLMRETPVSSEPQNETTYRLKRLLTLVALAVVVLLVALYAITLRNTLEINAQVDTIESGPYTVSSEAGYVETYLVQLRTLGERPLYSRTVEALDDVEESFLEIDEGLSASVAFIAENHVNKENREELAQGYVELAKLQEDYLVICRNPGVSDEAVKAFREERLNPLIDELLQVTARIFEVSEARVDQLCGNVDALGTQNMVMVSVLIAAVVAALVLYVALIRRQHRQEEILRAELNQALAIARSASKAKSDFLSNMSHDIRTPMNAIVGLTAIAGSHVDEPGRVRECLDRISISSKHLLSLINDVLDMSRIESGKIVLSRERFNMVELMDGVVTIAQPQAKARNLSFDVDMSGVSHESVVGDPVRLEQVLLNLVSNAIKYTPEGGSVSVTISEEAGGEEGAGTGLFAGAVGDDESEVRSYRFAVRDTGIGMTPEFMQMVFEPFERERSSSSGSTEGTGLGMAITKNIVDMMGGSITVESELGKGSVFTAVVPLRCTQGDGVESESAAQPVPGEAFAGASAIASSDAASDVSASSGLTGRVLLVEDNELNREIATELIEVTGAVVEQACDGVEAVEMLLAAPDGHFGLVFMDMQMPRMNGVEATREARRQLEEAGRPCPAIVAMTANAFSDDREAALSAGMSDFLTKPINLKELNDTLRKYLGAASVSGE